MDSGYVGGLCGTWVTVSRTALSTTGAETGSGQLVEVRGLGRELELSLPWLVCSRPARAVITELVESRSTGGLDRERPNFLVSQVCVVRRTTLCSAGLLQTRGGIAGVCCHTQLLHPGRPDLS